MRVFASVIGLKLGNSKLVLKNKVEPQKRIKERNVSLLIHICEICEQRKRNLVKISI